MMLEMEVIQDFQCAFSTRMYFSQLVLGLIHRLDQRSMYSVCVIMWNSSPCMYLYMWLHKRAVRSRWHNLWYLYGHALCVYQWSMRNRQFNIQHSSCCVILHRCVCVRVEWSMNSRIMSTVNWVPLYSSESPHTTHNKTSHPLPTTESGTTQKFD